MSHKVLIHSSALLQNDDDYLMHEGVLGMRWGFRRYQNEDGSLTELGKARRRKSDASQKIRIERSTERMKRREEKRKAKAAARDAERRIKEEAELNERKRKAEIEAEQKQHEAEMRDRKRQLKEAHDQRYKPVSIMTDEELSYMTNRLKAEQTYTKLLKEMTPEKKKGAVDLLKEQGGVFVKDLAKATSDVAVGAAKDYMKKRFDVIIDEKFTTPEQKAANALKKKYENAKQENEYYKNLADIERNKNTIEQQKAEVADRKHNASNQRKYEDTKAEADYYRNLAEIERQKKSMETPSYNQKKFDKAKAEAEYYKNLAEIEKQKSYAGSYGKQRAYEAAKSEADYYKNLAEISKSKNTIDQQNRQLSNRQNGSNDPKLDKEIKNQERSDKKNKNN